MYVPKLAIFITLILILIQIPIVHVLFVNALARLYQSNERLSDEQKALVRTMFLAANITLSISLFAMCVLTFTMRQIEK